MAFTDFTVIHWLQGLKATANLSYPVLFSAVARLDANKQRVATAISNNRMGLLWNWIHCWRSRWICTAEQVAAWQAGENHFAIRRMVHNAGFNGCFLDKFCERHDEGD